MNLWLWRYQSPRQFARDYIHFMADAEALDVLIASVRALVPKRTFPAQEMGVEDDPTGFPASFVWFRKLRVEVRAGDPELRQMHLVRDGDTVSLTLAPDFAGELAETLEHVKNGSWDFAFGPDEKNAGARDRESLALMFWQPLRRSGSRR